MANIYIGWDSREDIAYTVAKHSMEMMSRDVNVKPLKLHELRDEGIYTRSVDKLGSTEFTFTRFLVPYLNDYKGWALFTDCDVLALDDMNKLFELADDKYAVMCVKHDYTPSETMKMDGQQQTIYPRKNWSSVVLWNCAHPSNSIVTPELVNTESGMYMHRFMWLKDEEIGEIPYQWNYLVGWYQSKDPKLVHYTEGGPWFEEYKNCEYSKEWKDILCLKYDLVNHVKDRITEY
jgi:lipopolysaccharide biosynthesis glycosyltransferase